MGTSRRRPLRKSRTAMNLALAVLIALGSVFSPLAPGAPVPPALASLGAGTADDVLGQTLNGDISQPNFTKNSTQDAPNGSAFGNPRGVALDTVNHRLFVADLNNSRVLVFNLSNSNTLTDRQADYVLGQASFYSGSANRGGSVAANTLSSPYGINYDSGGNRLFVADWLNSRVLVYDVASITNGENAIAVLGQANKESGSANRGATAAAGTLNRPQDVYFDSGGNRLFVADTNNHRVLMYDTASITDGEDATLALGQANRESSSPNRGGSVAANSLQNPYGLAYDTSGNRLFVADGNNHRVLVYNSANLVMGQAADRVLGQANTESGLYNRTSTTSPNPGTLYYPFGMAMDSAGNRLFVADGSNGRLVVYDTNPINNGEDAVAELGQVNLTTGGPNRGTTTTVTAGSLRGPSSVAYDPTGNRLWLADSNNNRVLTYDVASIAPGEDADDLLGQLDGSGNAVFTRGLLDTSQVNARGLSQPDGTAIDTTGHRLFAVDSANNRVLVYNLSDSNILTDRQPDFVLGQADFTSGLENRGGSVAANTLRQPYGLAYDSAGNRLFVADRANHRVVVYDVAAITSGEDAVNVLGQANREAGSANRGGSVAANTLNLPAAPAYVAAINRLFIADSSNNRVVVYDVAAITDGEDAVNVLGQADLTTGAANRGTGVAPNTLSAPAGMAYRSTGNMLFVADSGNNRVVAYDIGAITDGEAAVNVLGQANLTSNSLNRGTGVAAANTLWAPGGVEYTSTGDRLFVADSNNHRVLVYDVSSITDGEDATAVLGQANFTSRTANRGSSVAANTMNGPVRPIYEAGSKRLVVSDKVNNRILIFNDLPASTTTLASSANPSTSGQSVTFTATVSGASGTPTGTVTFKDGATTLGTANLSSGTATYSTSALAVGSHSITAEYGGDSSYSSSTSSVLTQTVNKIGTTTTLASSPNPSASGQSVTFTATVSGAGGTPTGTVTFKDGATTLGTASLSSGAATYSISALAVGSHSITAEYGGDSTYDSSTSSALSQTVSGASTSTSLASSANPSTYGQAVTFAAGVSSSGGTPTGSVTFKDGSTALGTANLSSGSASFVAASLSAGSHSITAEYGGASNFAASTSSVLSQTVNKASTTTALASSPNPSSSGESVTFTASVSSAAGTPTGSVTFKDGSTALGSANLSSGTANFSTSALSAGTHSVTAEYGGDANFSGSASSALSQVISAAFSAAAWPDTFVPYTLSDGSPIYDPARDENPNYADVSSGLDDGAGALPSVYTASDGANLFFRFRIRGNPASPSQGGFESTAYSMAIAVNGAKVAVVGLDGKSPSTDYVYVTNADGSSVEQVYATPFTGSQAGARATSDGSGAYFVDLQVPISRITAMAPSVTASTPVQFFFGTSQAANLSVINKDFVPGSAVSFTNMAVSKLQGLTASSTTLASSPNPSSVGQEITLTATVTGSGGTPTGSVNFKEGNTTLGTGTLAGGIATYKTAGLSQGSHSITAVYAGDGSFQGSTSSGVLQVVNQAKSATTTTLVSSLNPSAPLQPILLTATVAATAGAPSGTVTFKDGTTTLGSAALSGGQALLTTSSLATGNHNITAEYGGDSSFNPSASAVLVQAVLPSRWLPVGAGGPGIHAMVFTPQGSLYVGGYFTSMGGISASSVARWDGATWSALGSGANGPVFALASDRNGNLYAGGNFTAAGGISTNNIAMWDGSKWSALGTGVGGHVKALAVDSKGNVYAGGIFNSAGGSAASFVAKWDGKKWSALGKGVGASVHALQLDASDNLYAGGRFSTAGGSSASYIARWDGTSWSALGSGLNSMVNALALDASGNIYAGGSFTSAGGVSARHIAKWNGNTWSALGSGTNNAVYGLTADGSGNVYAGGSFIQAGDTTVNRIARWDGSSWSPMGAGMNGSVISVAVDTNRTAYAAGYFTQAGDRDIRGIAVYRPAVDTTTTLTSTPNPADYGQRIVLSASVAATVGTPVGYLTFEDSYYSNRTILGRVALLEGQAVLNVDQALYQGTHSIVARYEGAATHLASSSTALSQVVRATPALSIEALARNVSGPEPPAAAKSSVYAITLKAYNPGSGDLNKVVITAQVPAGATVKSVAKDMTLSGQTVTWRYGGENGATISGNGSASSSFEVEVSPTASDTGQNITLLQSASASGTNPLTGDSLTASAGAVTVGPVAVSEGTISGAVKDGLSQGGLSKANVQVYDSLNTLSATVSTGNDGTYSVPKLAAGQYRLVFSKPNHLEYISKATVLAGQTTTEDATLTPLAGSLTGKITNAATGEALPSAIVMVQDTAGAYEEKDVSNPAGNFAFGNIPAGIPLLVSATHPDYTTGVESSAAPQEKYSTKSQTGKAYTVGLKLYPKPGEINGTVTDQSARTALGGVKVTAYDAKDNQVGTATTDSAGLYVLTGLSAGAYTLRFSRDPEYQPASGSVQVMPGQTANLDQALALRSGTVSGRVMDNSTGGTKIPGAKVRLLSSLGMELGNTTTNDKGEYQFAGLEPGTYTVDASASRYQEIPASQATVTVTAAGSVTQDLQLAPSPGAITGQITDAQTGAALPGTSVHLYDRNSNPAGKATSDSSGAYSVTGIPAGDYSLLFSRAGYHPGSATAQVPQGNTATANGVLQPKAGSVAGTVVDSGTRQPVSSSTVSLLDSSGVVQATALTDGNGKYAFSGLQPGTYSVDATHSDYNTGSGGRASVTVTADGSVTQDLELTPKPGSISGRATNATTGEAIPGVKVIVYDARMNLVGMASTDASGAYTVTNLVPGTYSLSADGSPVGYLPAKGSADVGPNQARSVDMVLTAAAGTLSGAVTDASSSDALAGINVTLTHPDGSVVTTRTSGTGEYVFTGVTAQVSLSVAAQGMPPFYLENTGSGAASTLTAGGRARVNLVLQPGPGRITGTVTGPVGSVPGASIRLYDANQNLVAETDTDGEGSYILSGLAPGAYTLLFSKMGYLGSSYSPRVNPGATTTLNITLAALAGAIHGLVKSSSTLKPLSKSGVSLVDSVGNTLETALSDGTGRYAFSSVSPGAYQVTAQHPDYITGSGGKAPVAMAPGGSANQDLSLDPRPASISGRVKSASTGEALAGVRVMAFDAKGNLAGAVTTDENGDYNITGLLDGDYVLTADGSAQGYLLSSANSTLKPGQSEVLNLALLPRAGSLSGILTNAANGEAIPDIEVVLTYPDGKEARVRSNGAGEYVFMDVRAEVLLTLTASETSFYMRMDWSTATGTAPAGGSATSHLKLKPRPGAITGKVESVLGPVTSAKLSLYNENSSLVEIGFSDPSGIFTFPALAPGKYTLVFSKAGYLSSTYTVLVKPGATTRQNIFPTPLAGSIAGTVKGLATLKPLSGAIVNLVDLAGVIVDSVLTDNSGRYSFSRVTPGTYQVLAGHTDHLSGTQAQATGSLAPEGYLSLNLLLAPRPATISGRVVSATTGQAIPGAVIRVYEPDGDLLTTVTADGNGNYVVKGVPESSDPYTLESTASNYLPGGGKVGVASGQKALLNLSLVPKLGSLAGRVTDSVTGKPIAGASVEVKSENGSLLAAARSDRIGGFLFIGLPSQTSLTVSATAPNYRTIAASSATVPFVLSSGLSIAQRRAAAASATVELQLGPNPGSVSGKAKDVQTGAPLPGATVQLYDSKGNLVATATTDPTGAYTFPEVPVGDYTISVVKNGFLAGSSSISLDAGQSGATDVPLPPEAGSISGTVRDSLSAALAGATVVLTDPAGQITSISAQGDGTYFFAGMPPGNYSMEANHTAYNTGRGSSTNLILEPGAAGKADLTLYPRPAAVGGTVADAVTGQPLPGVSIAVLDVAGNLLGTFFTDDLGLFRLRNLVAGSYTLVFSRPGYLDSSSSLTVKPNQSVDLMLGLTPASQSISGIVKDGSTGRGIGGATVVLLDGPGTILFTAKSNNTGRYSFGGLTPGTYTVLAAHSDYDAGEGSQVQITMISGEAAVQDLRLESKKGAIEVTVVDNTTGLVISGATIAITFGNSPIATLSSNSDGIASADGLARGAYTVTASTSGRASRSAAVTVESNRKSALVLRLGYAVRVQVLEKDTGETLTGVTVSLSKDGGEAAAGITGAHGVLLLDVTATGNYGLSVSGVGFDQVSQSSGSVSVYPETPAPSATLYLSRQKAPHLTLEISRFIPRQLPFEVRGMAARSELIYYGLSYANSGTAPATGVVITNTIPAGTSFVGPQEWVQVNERTYTHSVGTVAPGDRGGLTLVVAKEGMSTPGTIYTNTASIGDDGRNGRDLKMSSAVTNEFGLHVTYFPQLYRNWGGAW